MASTHLSFTRNNFFMSAIVLLFLSISVCHCQKRFPDPRGTYVILYEHESFRGGEHVVKFEKSCVNLEDKYSNWASSVDSHRSCASVCAERDCTGSCVSVYSRQGISKLRLVGLNDQIKSVKSCYS